MRKLLAIVTILTILAPNPVQAAISFVNSANNSSSPNTATTVTLPGSMQTGDLIVVATGVGDTANNGMTVSTSGYTRIPGVAATLYANDTNDTNLDVYYKIHNGTDTTVAFNAIGGTNASNVGLVMVFRGVNTVTPFDTNANTVTGIDTSSANPPSHNWSGASGAWTVIAASTGHTGGATATFTFPANYTTNAVQRAHNDTIDVLAGMGYRSSPADPEDPAAFTAATIGTASANSWAAVTMSLKPATAPTVTTQDASSITATGATFNGNLTNNNGATSTVRGFAWGTSATMNGDTATTTETGTFDTGAFTDSAQTLVCNTTYYYRPYAVNIAGTSTAPISNSFTTSACASLTVTNSTGDSNVTNTSATMNGDITILGGSNVTARGFAWGTDPTLSNGDTSTTTDTVGQPFSTGVFSQSVSNLRSNTTYYYRAYATDTSGNSYASTIESFVTTNTSSLRRVIRLFQGSRLNVLNGGKMIIRQQ